MGGFHPGDFIRIGEQFGRVTEKGLLHTEIQSEELAHLIADVLDQPQDDATVAKVRAQVAALTAKFPVYG